MWYLNKPKLGTNVHTATDAKFTGAIAGELMTVKLGVKIGTVIPGNTMFGVGVTAGTIIGAQATGPDGGAGT